MPVTLVLPVLTKPEIVEQAVAGVLSGQISLSMSNVEAILVLANAVGVSCLSAPDHRSVCLSRITLLATQLRLYLTLSVFAAVCFPGDSLRRLSPCSSTDNDR